MKFNTKIQPCFSFFLKKIKNEHIVNQKFKTEGLKTRQKKDVIT